MQFSTIFNAAVAALLLPSVVLACNGIEQDCCWNDKQGCMNQHKNWDVCGKSHEANFCENYKVSCGADCCQISTGWGRACP
ncbi:predicted protein [Plenodomus lingam JN3]|uniref:Predicted protein n=1 Tax=Leptosphaeria maculans (strain JN3 / isolate v23.1.3 / race Av1-4-5-6-7-8) TaxID=985895 RepID=E5ABW8_LEPMJ|nr:predicted protein [Plenodomus lingam JN3]CBY01159.1 predicted protein [Plenodomus lingam JN3]